MKTKIILFTTLLFSIFLVVYLVVNFGIITSFIVLLSLVLLFQSLFTLSWMLFAWENPHDAEKHKSPKDFLDPKYRFSLLIPARHEERVIGDTIQAIHKLNYPKELFEALVLIRTDDHLTLSKAKETISKYNIENIKVISFDSFPVNKPHALNVGLQNLKFEVTGIFDAEDEPHKNILQVINTVFQRGDAEVIQSGVQLMNYKTRWYSMHSVLEYFFWFKSGLLFFSKIGRTTLLGGNTVFVKTNKLQEINGWDEDMLTEDADLGIRLSSRGAKIKVIYDELHATREESPQKIKQLIKQRTRWNLGFLQIIKKNEWRNLPSFRQKFFALYILFSPFPQSIFFILAPFSIFIALTRDLPVSITLISIAPLYLFAIQIIIQVVASYEFTKAYKIKYPLLTPLKILITFFPYQILLFISAIRALFRMITGEFTWEKTHHSNLHRDYIDLEPKII